MISKSVISIFLSLVSLLTVATASAGMDFYVSLDGDDSALGTIEEPVATLEAARDLIRHHLSFNDYPAGGITVWVADGEYEMSKSLVLNENDSGTPECPIVWRSIEGANVKIMGGRRLDPRIFTKLNDSGVAKRLSRKAIENVVVADLSALGIRDFGKHKQYGHALSVVPAPLELFFQEQAMTLARYPNEGFIPIDKVIDSGSIPRNRDYSERGGVFEYTDDRHVVWAGQEDVWLQGTFGNGYADDKILVECIDPETQQVKLAEPHMYGIKGGRDYLHYFALNILDELDSPGEWYLDRKSGKLYFWPPSTLKDASIKVSILEDPVVCLEGVEHLTFRDFTVEASRGIGIYLERTNYSTVAGCIVRNIGTSGIFMGMGSKQTVPYITHDDYEGVPVSRRVGNLQGHIYKYVTWNRKAGTGNTILSCDVYNTGSGGIYVSGGDKRTLTPGNNEAVNCKVHDYNRRNRFLWSGINIDGVGNRIAHCEIFNSNFQAIYAHGNENIFEYNEIHHVVQNADDVSAWYLGRDPSDQGNILRYNYFHHIGRQDRRLNMGVYCDDGTAGVTVFGNVFYKMDTMHGVLYSNAGWDIRMENNIIIEPCANVVHLTPMYYSWARHLVQYMYGPEGVYRNRLCELIDIKKPPYSERYPHLVNYMDEIVPGKEWEGMRARRNVLTNNLVVGSTKDLVRLDKGGYAQFSDLNNYTTMKDPGFVDYQKQNFELKQDSEVFEMIPGFKPVPFSKMGLFEDEFRKL